MKQIVLFLFFSSLQSLPFQSLHCPRLSLSPVFNSSLSSYYRFSLISLSLALLQCLWNVFISVYLILTSSFLVPNRVPSFTYSTNIYSVPSHVLSTILDPRNLRVSKTFMVCAIME